MTRALVTGASRGIGGAVCRTLAAEALARGERPALVLTVRRLRPDVEALAEELRAAGARVLALEGDLGGEGVPERLAAEAAAFCGGLDLLVSNAGTTGPGRLAALDPAGWDRLFAVNVRAPWLLARTAHPALRDSRGAMVAVASMSGVNPHAGQGAYSASKAALIMLCRQLAQEWAADGIRVNVVSPGMVRTPLTEALYRHEPTAAARAALVPMGRVGRPEDIAAVVGFLARPGYLTGENILVDGGFSATVMGRIPGLPPGVNP